MVKNRVLSAVVLVALIVLVGNLGSLKRVAYYELGFHNHPTWYTESSLRRWHQSEEHQMKLLELEREGRVNSEEYVRLKIEAEQICLKNMEAYGSQIEQELKEASEFGFTDFAREKQLLFESINRAIESQRDKIESWEFRLQRFT